MNLLNTEIKPKIFKIFLNHVDSNNLFREQSITFELMDWILFTVLSCFSRSALKVYWKLNFYSNFRYSEYKSSKKYS